MPRAKKTSIEWPTSATAARWASFDHPTIAHVRVPFWSDLAEDPDQ